MGATCNSKGKIITNRHLSGDGIFIISSECADTEQLRSPASCFVVHQLSSTRIWTQGSWVGSANAKKGIDKMLLIPDQIRANVLARTDAINRQIWDKINLSISVPMMWCCKKTDIFSLKMFTTNVKNNMYKAGACIINTLLYKHWGVVGETVACFSSWMMTLLIVLAEAGMCFLATGPIRWTGTS